jgi:hypothetical protein
MIHIIAGYIRKVKVAVQGESVIVRKVQLDQLMVVAFIFAALMVIYNVILRRLERGGMPKRLEILDSMLLWAYPLLFLDCVWVVFEITG